MVMPAAHERKDDYEDDETGPAPALSSKQLLIVLATYYPDTYGGAERQATILAEAFARLGVRTNIVAPTLQRALSGTETTSFGSVRRIYVKDFPNYGGLRLASTLAWTWRFVREYAHPDANIAAFYVFHARLHVLPALLAAWIRKTPLLVKLGGGGEASDFIALKSKRFFYGEWILRALVKRTDGFVANSKDIVDDLKGLGVPEQRIFAFPNGVEVPPIEKLHDAIPLRSGRRFMFAGRMVSDKSVEVLFDATRLAKARGLDMEMTMLGDGPERQRLSECIASAGLSGRLHMPGHTDNVYDSLFTNDFFVSASRREGQSNALLEAMSAGCIPIVYGASGAADVVTDGETGLLVRVSDSEHFAAAFERALAMPEADRQRMSRAAYEAAAQRMGVDIVANKSLQILEIVSRRRESSTDA